MLVGQILAAPERLRRDAPVLPAWGVPELQFTNLEFEGKTDDGLPSHDFGTALHDEYGVPHEEYGK